MDSLAGSCLIIPCSMVDCCCCRWGAGLGSRKMGVMVLQADRPGLTSAVGQAPTAAVEDGDDVGTLA